MELRVRRAVRGAETGQNGEHAVRLNNEGNKSLLQNRRDDSVSARFSGELVRDSGLTWAHAPLAGERAVLPLF